MKARSIALGVAWCVLAACNTGYSSSDGPNFTAADAGPSSNDDDGGMLGGDAEQILPTDAEIPGDSSADGSAGPRCYPGDPFNAPTALTTVNSTGLDAGPRLSADELSLYFYSNRPAFGSNWDLFVATRGNLMTEFGAPQPLAMVNDANAIDLTPTPSPDALSLYFASTRANSNYDTMFVSTRATSSGTFGAAGSVDSLNAASSSSISPFVIADGTELYFSTDRNGGQYDIYVAPRTGGIVGTPVAVSVNDGAAQDTVPVLSRDGLALYFTSDRAGTVGDEDIWVVTRATTAAVWGTPRHITELATAGPDQMGSISADQCEIYFSRSGATGLAGLNAFDLYVAYRSPH